MSNVTKTKILSDKPVHYIYNLQEKAKFSIMQHNNAEYFEGLLMDNKEKSIYHQIGEIARQHQATKVVLFGQRARKTHGAKSDIDLVIYGCANFRDLWFDLQKNVHTLLEFPFVNMDDCGVSTDLALEIERDGIVLYEKI